MPLPDEVQRLVQTRDLAVLRRLCLRGIFTLQLAMAFLARVFDQTLLPSDVILFEEALSLFVRQGLVSYGEMVNLLCRACLSARHSTQSYIAGVIFSSLDVGRMHNPRVWFTLVCDLFSGRRYDVLCEIATHVPIDVFAEIVERDQEIFRFHRVCQRSLNNMAVHLQIVRPDRVEGIAPYCRLIVHSRSDLSQPFLEHSMHVFESDKLVFHIEDPSDVVAMSRVYDGLQSCLRLNTFFQILCTHSIEGGSRVVDVFGSTVYRDEIIHQMHNSLDMVDLRVIRTRAGVVWNLLNNYPRARDAHYFLSHWNTNSRLLSSFEQIFWAMFGYYGCLIRMGGPQDSLLAMAHMRLRQSLPLSSDYLPDYNAPFTPEPPRGSLLLEAGVTLSHIHPRSTIQYYKVL